MAVVKMVTIYKYIGDTADTKPTSVPVGSTYLDRQTGALYITYDGTNWTLNDQIGEVQASPTANTILGRLKAILTGIVLAAGSNIIGKVGIDQTTPGTTNGVQVNAALPAGDNNVGNVDIVTLPAGNLGQQAMAASLSVVPASNVTDATYIGDIKFGEALPAGTANIGDVDEAAIACAAADIHAPAANTAAVVTYAAVADVKHVITGIAWSYAGGIPVGGNLKIEDVSGTTVFSIDIDASGPGAFEFPKPKKAAAVNTAMIITLAAGGAGVTGKVSILNHYQEA